MTLYDIQAATDKAAQWLERKIWAPIRPALIGAWFTMTVFAAGLIIGLGITDTVPRKLAADAIRLAYKTGIDTAILTGLDNNYTLDNPQPLPFPQCNKGVMR